MFATYGCFIVIFIQVYVNFYINCEMKLLIFFIKSTIGESVMIANMDTCKWYG